jgi:hypothetical protein
MAVVTVCSIYGGGLVLRYLYWTILLSVYLFYAVLVFLLVAYVLISLYGSSYLSAYMSMLYL